MCVRCVRMCAEGFVEGMVTVGGYGSEGVKNHGWRTDLRGRGAGGGGGGRGWGEGHELAVEDVAPAALVGGDAAAGRHWGRGGQKERGVKALTGIRSDGCASVVG